MGSKQIRSKPVLRRKPGAPSGPRPRISQGGAAGARTSKIMESELAKLAEEVDSTGESEGSMTVTTQKIDKRTAILTDADQKAGIEYELDETVGSTGVTGAAPRELLKANKDLAAKVDLVHKELFNQITGAMSAVGAISDSASPLMTGVAGVQTTATAIAHALNNVHNNVNGLSLNLGAVSHNVLALQTSLGAIENKLNNLVRVLNERLSVETVERVETVEPVTRPKEFTLVFPDVPEDADAQVHVLEGNETVLRIRKGPHKHITFIPDESKPRIYSFQAYGKEVERVTFPNG